MSNHYRIRRERRIAFTFGLPWGWRLRQSDKRLIATGSPLPCGHKSVSVVIRNGDLLDAAGRLAYGIGRHKAGI